MKLLKPQMVKSEKETLIYAYETYGSSSYSSAAGGGTSGFIGSGGYAVSYSTNSSGDTTVCVQSPSSGACYSTSSGFYIF